MNTLDKKTDTQAGTHIRSPLLEAMGLLDRKNRFLCLLLFFLALLPFLLLALPKDSPPGSSPGDSSLSGVFSDTDAPEGDFAVITVSGSEVARIPLSSTPRRVTISQGQGVENVIMVTESGAYMESSTCDNQLCVHMGTVTHDNWEFRPNGAFIICLPNQVSVELVVKDD